MFSRSIVAFAAACLYCAPSSALYVDQLHNNDVLNTGRLTIQLEGACTAKVVLNDVGLHTYSPLDNAAEALWITGQTRAGTTIANYYSMVLVDSQLNIISAYAPARTVQGIIADNGLHVAAFTETSSHDSFKSRFTLHAAQDSAGALDGLLDYLEQHHPQAIHCDGLTEDSYLTAIDESQSSVVVHDSTADTPLELRTRTSLAALTVAALATDSVASSPDGSYLMERQLQPLQIRVRFDAQSQRRH